MPSGEDGSLPWEELARCDAVYFTGGDVAALRAARRAQRARRDVARAADAARAPACEVDVLVGSGEDAGERFEPGELDPPPRIVVTTAGALGGWIRPGGPFRAAPIPGPVVGRVRLRRLLRRRADVRARRSGSPVDEAVALGARCGAAVLTGAAPTSTPADRITAAGSVALDKVGHGGIKWGAVVG